MLVPSFWIIYPKIGFTPVTNFPEWLNVNRLKNKQSKKNSLWSATGMTNLCFLPFFPRDLLVRETPNTVWVSDKLVSQDIVMFMLVLLEQKDENKRGRCRGSKQIGMRYFDNARKVMERWVMDILVRWSEIGGRKTGRWLLVPLLFQTPWQPSAD